MNIFPWIEVSQRRGSITSCNNHLYTQDEALIFNEYKYIWHDKQKNTLDTHLWLSLFLVERIKLPGSKIHFPQAWWLAHEQKSFQQHQVAFFYYNNAFRHHDTAYPEEKSPVHCQTQEIRKKTKSLFNLLRPPYPLGDVCLRDSALTFSWYFAVSVTDSASRRFCSF